MEVVLRSLNEFSISYEEEEKKRREYERRLERLGGQLMLLIVRGEGMKRLKEIERLEGIEEHIE